MPNIFNGTASIADNPLVGNTLRIYITDPSENNGVGFYADQAAQDGIPIVATYRWYANGNAIVGATNSTLKVTAALLGEAITVQVSYTNGNGVSGATPISSPQTVNGIFDYAADITGNADNPGYLDSLQTELSSITGSFTILDGATIPVEASITQLSSDAGALALIRQHSYLVDVSGSAAHLTSGTNSSLINNAALNHEITSITISGETASTLATDIGSGSSALRVALSDFASLPADGVSVNVTLQDSVANIESNLVWLQANAGALSGIQISSGSNEIDLTAQTYLANISALQLISGAPDFVIKGSVADLDAIASYYTNHYSLGMGPQINTFIAQDTVANIESALNVSGLTVPDYNLQGYFGQVEGIQIIVADSAAAIQANLAQLEANVSQINSITIADPNTPLVLSLANFNSDSNILAKISGQYAITLSGSFADFQIFANQGASPSGSPESHVTGFNLVDTGANISANIDNIQNACWSHVIQSITVVNDPNIYLTPTQISNDADAILAMQGPFTLYVIEPAHTPILFKGFEDLTPLQNGRGFNQAVSVQDTAANISNQYNNIFWGDALLLEVGRDPIAGNIVVTDGASNAVSINSYWVEAIDQGFFHFSGTYSLSFKDSAQNIGQNFNFLVANYAHISSIVVTDTSTMTLTMDQVISGLATSGVGGIFADFNLIAAPNFGLQINGVTAANIGTIELGLLTLNANHLPFHVAGIEISDSAAHLNGLNLADFGGSGAVTIKVTDFIGANNITINCGNDGGIVTSLDLSSIGGIQNDVVLVYTDNFNNSTSVLVGSGTGALRITLANEQLSDAQVITSPTTFLFGVARDGDLANALVWVDANNNGVLDSNESYVITNSQGQYSGLVSSGTGTIRVEANPNGSAVDTATGQFFTGSYAAPLGYSVVNPLTTLVVAAGGNAAAMTAVQAALGLGSVDLSTYDPTQAYKTAANTADLDTAIQVQSAVSQVANIMNTVANAIHAAGASTTQSADTAAAVASALLASAHGGALNLSGVSVISAAITAAANGLITDATQLAHINAQTNSIATAVAAINAQISSIVSTATTSNAPTDLLNAMNAMIADQVVNDVTLSGQVTSAV